MCVGTFFKLEGSLLWWIALQFAPFVFSSCVWNIFLSFLLLFSVFWGWRWESVGLWTVKINTCIRWKKEWFYPILDLYKMTSGKSTLIQSFDFHHTKLKLACLMTNQLKDQSTISRWLPWLNSMLISFFSCTLRVLLCLEGMECSTGRSCSSSSGW